MKAINFIGQMMIDNAILTRATNKIEIFALLQATKFNLKQKAPLQKRKPVQESIFWIDLSCRPQKAG
ncbi:hypothetical protein [Legionella feeleii]|uniref:Uncharacterized protein n=1 Tax=Legionella feeleii TaxID=453 RepID=A0A378KLA4_9GAMM|nr:hypothetical protein [Legionella feeleii]STX88282.1 Uncharacterised protein [Legionella feeleii]